MALIGGFVFLEKAEPSEARSEGEWLEDGAECVDGLAESWTVFELDEEVGVDVVAVLGEDAVDATKVRLDGVDRVDLFLAVFHQIIDAFAQRLACLDVCVGGRLVEKIKDDDEKGLFAGALELELLDDVYRS